MPRGRGGQTGQAAEPSADLDELEADEPLLEPLDSREELDEPLDDEPLDDEPLEDSLDEPLDDPPDEAESPELLGAGTEAEELLRESVR